MAEGGSSIELTEPDESEKPIPKKFELMGLSEPEVCTYAF